MGSKEHKEYLNKEREKIRFKYLPEERQNELTRQGLNPFQTEKQRQANREKYEIERRKWFDNLPAEVRKALKRLGLDPRDKDVIIHRTTGAFTIKK